MSDWRIFQGNGRAPKKGETARKPPAPPPWRRPGKSRDRVLAATFQPGPELIDAVNTALYLRRPLLVTGKPGTGKSSLIYAVARELALGDVLSWAITSRASLKDGLYTYDALGRLQDLQEKGERAKATRDAFKKFLTLQALGTALHSVTQRAVLIDEIDKSDVDLPNDLLNVLDRGQFFIPELERAGEGKFVVRTLGEGEVEIEDGKVEFTEFPFIVMTSNGERDFPAPFLRRCVQFDLAEPDEQKLIDIVGAHFSSKISKDARTLIEDYLKKRGASALATDQLLNAVHMLHDSAQTFSADDEKRLLATLFKPLG